MPSVRQPVLGLAELRNRVREENMKTPENKHLFKSKAKFSADEAIEAAKILAEFFRKNRTGPVLEPIPPRS